MKFFITLVTFLSISSVYAQIDFEFFQLNENSEAKALIQRQIDTIKVNADLVLEEYELEKVEIWDTTIFKNRNYIVTENTNIRLIQSFGEIVEEYIIVQKPSSVTKPINCNIDCYEKITKQETVLSKSNLWSCNGDLLNPKSWHLNNVPTKKDSVSEYVLKAPYLTKTIEVPIQYIKVRMLKTNRSLTKKEIKILELECVKKQAFPYKSIHYKKILKQTKRYPNQYNSYKILQNASVKNVKTLKKKELKKIIIPLKKALQNKGYSLTINNEIEDDFKRALIQFQIKNGLPIGQFDMKTIEILLK
ncbi:MAG: hypothetical protein AB8G11_20840 [Saprospiraceae bacterium]